ncbi:MULTISPECIES: GNAT family N-acetyltransferase [unclassified Sedimentibacter]|uniref:GNAT family N-acetyltransferase n=1 Tax=unclassified Sedimentibacter TaxID=2649220 RepID=UPI0027E1FDB8|nr:GNAT family N-acetyltransferase [Sedimentibacter sp. MB35-C1]WMJ77534.1 N-acetyltransferase family protein [Sedimentibacter sp. MB35-C1]
MDYEVEVMKASDWSQVAKIYAEGIMTKIATFQSEAPSWEEWDKGHCKSCRLVARTGDIILGWAALSPVSSRCVYAGVAEVSIYINKQYRGQKVGTALLEKLIELSEENGYWTLQSGIIKENTSSLNLHRKCGFREIGYRERLGKMDNGKWHDVVLVERRSKLVG